MYKATGGVNTHKGAIYSLGLICASIGRLWQAEAPFANTEVICNESASFVKDSLKTDFEKADTSTAGGRLYQKLGITGIRGEAASGFESVLKIGLPNYKKLISQGLSQNDAGVITLLHFVANIKDTNLYHRGGEAGAQYAKRAASDAIKQSTYERRQIEDMDDEFIKRNLSPGGCADLLAITYFLNNIER
jgi:triphosphoribosyl-dephospho-CoA synthetase